LDLQLLETQVGFLVHVHWAISLNTIISLYETLKNSSMAKAVSLSTYSVEVDLAYLRQNQQTTSFFITCCFLAGSFMLHKIL